MQTIVARVKKINRWILLAIAVLIVGAVIVGISAISARRNASAEPEIQTVAVAYGDISGDFSASGHLEANQDVSLAMPTSGIVKAVRVKVGDQVKHGDILVQLDDTDALRNVKVAENGLETAKLQAQSAELNYNKSAGWKPNDNQLASAVASANNAAAAVQAAQSDYDRVAFIPSISGTQQSLALQQATNNYIQSKANLDYILTNRPELAGPQINLDIANLGVVDAQLSLDGAKSALARLTLVAPFDGTITVVNVHEGEMAGGAVVQIITADRLEGLLDVGEVDLANLSLNQPATITLDAWPTVALTGRVTGIDPAPVVSSNSDVVNYGVHLTIDPTDLPIRTGMSFRATIQTFNMKHVLLVPNGAVTLEDGKYYVTLVNADKSQKKVEVIIGVHNFDQTQILSGLEEGNEVVVNSIAVPVGTFGPGAGGGPNGNRP